MKYNMYSKRSFDDKTCNIILKYRATDFEAKHAFYSIISYDIILYAAE